MTKDAAIKEARIGAKLKGGTWYVTRKGSSYDAVPADFYTKRKHGGIAETIDLDAMAKRNETPGEVQALAPKPATIDLTPEGCKTPEGAARVNETLKAFEDSAAELANATMQFLDENHWELKAAITNSQEFNDSTRAEILEGLHQLEALTGGRRRAQERFLAAVGGHDTKEASK